MKVDKSGVPQFHELIKPVVQALREMGGGASNSQIIDRIIDNLYIPQETAEIPHNDKLSCTELEYRAAWARTYLKKTGYINNPSRSYWELNFDINIDDINPQEIVDNVRAEAAKMADNLEKQEITKIEAAQAFEEYVSETLKEYMENQDIKYNIPEDGFDFYLPDGFGEISEPVFIEVMYGNNIQSKTRKLSESTYNRINKRNGKFLFITAGKVFNKNILEQELKEICGTDVQIWDMYDLTDKIPTFPEKITYLSEPRANIVKSLIRDASYEKLQKENEIKVKKLKEAYRNEKLVLVLGAGVSIDAGIPLWSDLINRLTLRMLKSQMKPGNDEESSAEDNTKLSDKDIKIINRLVKKTRKKDEETPLMQMRYIRAGLKNDEYYNTVREELYAKKRIRTDTELLEAIVNLSAPKRSHENLQSILTYNFDNLVEQCLAKRNIAHNIIYNDSAHPVSNKLNIYHVHGYLPQHGDIDKKTELIFSEEDYHRVYGRAYGWSNMAQVTAFQNNVCLFVGCSLTDPNLRRLLDEAMGHPEEPRHFAVMKRKKFEAKTKDETEAIKWYQDFDDNIRDQIFKSFGISVIWVDEYSEIPDILNSLSSE